MTDTPEQTAEKIAARGREALISRLRPAFEEAAAAHSDVLKLAPEQIEAMVQRAADRADGLQWRRALAGIATEEMGISLGEALSHPAVIRAHEICGAPSYEDSLAELGPIGVRATTPASKPVTTAAAAIAEPEPESEPVAAEPEPAVAEPEPAGAEPEPAGAEPEPAVAEEPAAAEPESLVAEEPEAAAPDGEPGGAEGVLAVWDDTTAEPASEDEPEANGESHPAPSALDSTEATEAVAETDGEDPDEAETAAGAGADTDADAEAEADLDAGQELPVSEHDEPSADAAAKDDDHGLETDFGSFGSETSPLAGERAASETPDQATAQYSFEDFEEEFYEDGLRLSVIHLGGIANLEPAETDIELLMSSDGLDIIRGGNDVLGRLEWDQVKALEVPLPRGRRRVRRPGPTHLVIRTARGDASFEVPDVTPAELRQHLAPVIDDHVRRP